MARSEIYCRSNRQSGGAWNDCSIRERLPVGVLTTESALVESTQAATQIAKKTRSETMVARHSFGLRALGANKEWHANDAQELDTEPSAYTSACQVSNDPPLDGEVPELMICNITAYKCNAAGASAMVNVNFDYEIHSNPNSSMEKILPYLEETMLEHLAADMGVSTCEASRRDRRRLDYFTVEQLDLITGVSLLAVDQVDTRYGNCVTESSGDSSECTPIQGAVTVFTRHRASDVIDAAIAQAVKDTIKFGMGEDLYVAEGNIDKVAFVGDRAQLESEQSVPPSAQTTTDKEPSASQKGMSSTTIGLVAGVMSLVVLIVLALLFIFCRRRRSRESLNDDDNEPGHVKQVWEGPESPEILSQGSLADRDSLALRPQIGWSSSPDRSASTSSLSLSPMKEPRAPSAVFSQPVSEFDAAMHELDEIAEAATNGARAPSSISRSRQFSFGDEPPPRREVRSDMAVRVSSFGAEESDAGDAGYESNASEETPRRVLQMS